MALRLLSTLCLLVSRMLLFTEREGMILFEKSELDPVNRLHLLCRQT